jgi:transposase
MKPAINGRQRSIVHVRRSGIKKSNHFLQTHPDGQVIALVEMSLYFQATKTRVWAAVRQTPVVCVSHSAIMCISYGAVNLRTGHESALPTADMKGEITAAFLRDLLLCYYPTQPILLLWDRAKWHKGKAVRRVFADHPRLDTVFLPPASPHLNPQEHVWGQTLAKITHNHTYPTFSQLKAAFLDFLSSTLFSLDWLNKYAPTILFES